jgi:hypothetical protein
MLLDLYQQKFGEFLPPALRLALRSFALGAADRFTSSYDATAKCCDATAHCCDVTGAFVATQRLIVAM